MTGPIKIFIYGEAQKIEFLDSLNFSHWFLILDNHSHSRFFACGETG